MESDEADLDDDGHTLWVERLLPDGRWVDFHRSDLAETVRFRAACDCGWRGRDILGDHATGKPDQADADVVYDWWDEHHAPGYAERSVGDPDFNGGSGQS